MQDQANSGSAAQPAVAPDPDAQFVQKTDPEWLWTTPRAQNFDMEEWNRYIMDIYTEAQAIFTERRREALPESVSYKHIAQKAVQIMLYGRPVRPGKLSHGWAPLNRIAHLTATHHDLNLGPDKLLRVCLEHHYDGNAGLPVGVPSLQIMETKCKSSTEDFDKPMLSIRSVRCRGKTYGLDEAGEPVPGFDDDHHGSNYGRGHGKGKGKKGGGGTYRSGGNAGTRSHSRPASEGGYVGKGGGLFGQPSRGDDPWSEYRQHQDAGW